MKLLAHIVLCLLLVMPAGMMAQDITALQKEAEQLEATNQEEALRHYQEILRQQPANINALCKSSQLCSSIGHRQAAKSAQLTYFNAASRFAGLALRLDPASSEANFAMALAKGRIALVVGGREKIEAVSDVKQYTERSLKSDPNSYKAWHVLGKWHYEVSNLSGLERTAARLLYGGLPPASLQDCIACYEKSRSLNPDFVLNYLELAKAYHRSNQNAKAIELLNKLLVMNNKIQQDDARVKDEARKLLNDLSKK